MSIAKAWIHLNKQSGLTPLDVMYVRFALQDRSDGLGELSELWCRIDHPQEFSNLRSLWLCEDEELIIITILVTTAQGECKAFVFKGNVAPPIFHNDVVGHYTHTCKFLTQILG